MVSPPSGFYGQEGWRSMNVLVLGGGGREHALAWKLKQGSSVTRVVCAPGNPGIAADAETAAFDILNPAQVLDFSRKNDVDLVVIGPEAPLVAGVTDALTAAEIPVFGPSQWAAQLESSKSFAKTIFDENRIPTAEGRSFTDPKEALRYLEELEFSCVVKADGLAAGKGVILCSSQEEAIIAIDRIMTRREFGEAGDRVLIEEKLTGEEVSVFALTDGESVLVLPTAQDHKRVNDDDEGPNTGGMGAYCPAPVLDDKQMKRVVEKILVPTVKAMARAGHPYRGVLYAGLMLTESGPKILEYNCRFGDPECQVLMMMIDEDLAPLLKQCAGGSLDSGRKLKLFNGAAACIVMASGGYPDKFKKGFEIRGIPPGTSDLKVFHAGTAIKDGRLVNNGGRVLGVTARGKDLKEALKSAYAAAGQISWESVHYRKDIGRKGLKRLGLI